MLKTGTNVNVCDKNKCTPLHLAVNQGNDAGVKALLASRHCDVNCQVLDVRTASGEILERSFISTVRSSTLIRHGNGTFRKRLRDDDHMTSLTEFSQAQ